MPTYWSQSLIPTLRNVPAEAEVPSHQLMLRAGLVRKLGAGVYDYLPLGLRALHKVMAIIRQEMAAAGAQEVFLPALVPIELFHQTDRDVAYGDNLFRIKDRHGRDQALGPTHEEVVVEMVAGYVDSYKQLPLTVYQIQTKFRDEFRPRFGILRSREFQMKDAYSFHMKVDGPGGLNEGYQAQYDAYCRIFTRCGLPYVTVEAESGPIGGSASHEFMVITPTGEDTILESDKGNYAANVEKCETGARAFSESFSLFSAAPKGAGYAPALAPKGELTKIHTPNCPGIDDVCAFFKKSLGSKLATKNMLKSLVYIATGTDDDADPRKAKDPWYILAIVRGDHEVNEGKLKAQAARLMGKPVNLNLAPPDFAKLDGWAIGFVGPHALVAGGGRDDTALVVDPDAAVDSFWVTGANEVDHHVKLFHWKRDVLDKLPQAGPESAKVRIDAAQPAPVTPKARIIVSDIRNALDGDPSPRGDGGVLRAKKGIEVGHVFKLGDKYTRAMNFTILGPDNQRLHPLMGCYGIGVNRILAAAIERTAGNGPETGRLAGPETHPEGRLSGGAAGYDESGIIWPAAIAPYQVLITTMKWEGAIKDAAIKLAAALETPMAPGSAGGPAPSTPGTPGSPSTPGFPGIDVLVDDRDERPGVKFKDADLIGIPIRVTIGERALAEGKFEVKARNGSNGPKGELVDIAAAPARVLEMLKTL